MIQTKTCKCCGEVKPVEEFYRHPAMLDGRLNQCKECKRARQRAYSQSPAGRAADKRKYENHKEKIIARNAAYRERHKEYFGEKQKEWYRKNTDKAKARSKQWYEDNRVEVSGRVLEYQKTAKGKEVRQRALKRYRLRYPDKAKAHALVGNAIRDGRLIREDCEICGDVAEAHHEDYSQPFDIRWLCFVHHRELGHDQVVVRGATSCA